MPISPSAEAAALHDVRLEVVLGRIGDRAQDHELQDVVVAGPIELGGELGEGGRIAQDVLVHDLAGALDHGVVDGYALASFGEKRAISWTVSSMFSQKRSPSSPSMDGA